MRYQPHDPSWFSKTYHAFNIFEGFAWAVLALLVLHRCARFRRSVRLEVAYACAFLAFALSDFREAWEQSSWLIWLKLFNLIALFWLRHLVMSRFYPQARLY